MMARTRKPAAERREEVARAVLRIIGERGLTSFTMTSLAEEVGVTSGALFRHFESRHAMLHEAVLFAVLQIEKTFPDASLPPMERLLQLAGNRVRVLGSDPGLAWLLRSEQAYLALPEETVRRLRGLVERSKRCLLGALREGVSQGSIRDDIKPEVLLILVMGTIHALAGMPGVHHPAIDRRRARPDDVFSALERLLAPPGETAKRRRMRSRRKANRDPD